MLTLPEIIERAEQSYVAIRTDVTMSTISAAADKLFPRIFAWAGAHGLKPAEAPFIKYNVIDMARGLEIEIGLPTPSPILGDGEVIAGMLPAGRYARLVYTGPYSRLYDATAVMIGWAKEKSLHWDAEATSDGDRFACRLEIYKTDPAEEPDPSKWHTEIAIKLAN